MHFGPYNLAGYELGHLFFLTKAFNTNQSDEYINIYVHNIQFLKMIDFSQIIYEIVVHDIGATCWRSMVLV